MYKKTKREGMALILVVVTLGIVGMGAALVLAQASLSNLAIHRYAQQEVAARNILYSCHDEVIAQFRHDTDYLGTSVLTTAGTCTVSIVADVNNRAVTLTYTDGTITKTLSYTIDLSTYTEGALIEL